MTTELSMVFLKDFEESLLSLCELKLDQLLVTLKLV